MINDLVKLSKLLQEEETNNQHINNNTNNKSSVIKPTIVLNSKDIWTEDEIGIHVIIDSRPTPE